MLLLLRLGDGSDTVGGEACRSIGAVLAANLLVHVGHDLRRQPEPVDDLVLPLVDQHAVLITHTTPGFIGRLTSPQ